MDVFSLLLGFGAAVALLRVFLITPVKEQIIWLVTGLLILAGGLLGARVGFVIANYYFFKDTPISIFHFWLGGLSWAGAIIGGILASFPGKLLLKKSFTAVWDVFSVMLLPISTTTWLGCWFIGTAYGLPLESGTWWGMVVKDYSGLQILRVPTQISAAISLILFLGVAELLIGKERKQGVRSKLLWLIFSVHLLLFSCMRVDPNQKIMNIRADIIASIILIVFVLGYSFIDLVKDKKLSRKTKISDGENV